VVRTNVATKMSAALATTLRPRSLCDVKSAVRKRVMRRERSMHGSTSHADGWGCDMVEREVRCWCAATRHLNLELAYEKADKLKSHCFTLAGWLKSDWAELTAGVFGLWFIHFLVSTTLISGE